MRDVLFEHREFLNLTGNHSTAVVLAHLSRELAEDGSLNWEEAAFMVSDCDRKITLSIDLGADLIDNSIYKLAQVKLAAAGLEKALRSYKRRRK